MSDKADRYQYQPWHVRLWRRRFYLAIPFVAMRVFLTRSQFEDGDILSFRICWSIAVGEAQAKMNWLWDWDEVKARLD
jgi:hypothetical protein